MLTSSKENEEQCNEANTTTKTHQWQKTNGKNVLPTLSIYRIFGVSKIHYNLFDFEIQIILVKVGFYFLFSIVLGKMTFNGVFKFFQVNIGSWLLFKLFLSFSSLEQN